MSLDDYRRDIAQRDKNRALYAELAGECEACISLSAPSAAPMGLESTGDPSCTAHASYLGIPAVSLPVLSDEGLPLGLQVVGFVNGDANAVASAAAIGAVLKRRHLPRVPTLLVRRSLPSISFSRKLAYTVVRLYRIV
jgi:Asp-tRNA(Asn)/Glu-tRNA(Gln) amidotransferase A subunit family amidase